MAHDGGHRHTPACAHERGFTSDGGLPILTAVASGFRLGVDVGTSNTVAVLRWPDGRFKPLLFDGSPLLPSGVYADPAGELLTGREAAHSARIHPERFEPNPKRRIDDGTVLLGDLELPVVELIAAVLSRVAAEVRAVVPGQLGSVTLTCPAAWGPRRRSLLVEAAGRVDLSGPLLLAEPVAAASYFVGLPGVRLPVNSCLVVFDFGAGTFDASVVRRAAQGFEVLASEGLSDAGGLDVDAAVLGYFAATYSSRAPEMWSRLEQPRTIVDRRTRRLLWDDVRAAKEVLSRATHTMVPVPLVDVEAPLGREQLERLARPILERTVVTTRAAVRSAGLGVADVAAVFLVGGASRMPLVATLLHRALGIAPTAIEQPELVVAEGAVHDDRIGATLELAPAGSSDTAVTVSASVSVPREIPTRVSEPLPSAVSTPSVPTQAQRTAPPSDQPTVASRAVPGAAPPGLAGQAGPPGLAGQGEPPQAPGPQGPSPWQGSAGPAMPVPAAGSFEPVVAPEPRAALVPVDATARRQLIRTVLTAPVRGRTWLETLHLVLNPFVAPIGLAMLAMTLLLGAPLLGAVERGRAALLLRERVPGPGTLRPTGRAAVRVTGYVFVLLLLGPFAFALVAVVWVAGGVFAAGPVLVLFGVPFYTDYEGNVSNPPGLIALTSLAGWVVVFLAPWIVRGLATANRALLHATLGRMGPRRGPQADGG